MLRKIISFIIIFPLLLVPLFCSCVQKAEADTGVEHCHDDEDSNSATHDEHSKDNHSHQCDCSHSLIPGEVVSHVISFITPVGGFFPEAADVPSYSITSLKSLINFAYLGPPLGKSSAVPLYIQQHTLRI